MYLDLALAGLINYEPNVRLNIITDQDQNNQTVPEVLEHANEVPEITEPVKNHVEEEPDQTVPETQSANTKKLSKKKRKPNKKNFGNKAKKRNQRRSNVSPTNRIGNVLKRFGQNFSAGFGRYSENSGNRPQISEKLRF